MSTIRRGRSNGCKHETGGVRVQEDIASCGQSLRCCPVFKVGTAALCSECAMPPCLETLSQAREPEGGCNFVGENAAL